MDTVSVRCIVTFTVHFYEGLNVFEVMGLILKTVSTLYSYMIRLKCVLYCLPVLALLQPILTAVSKSYKL
jgi:hypothetical protein